MSEKMFSSEAGVTRYIRPEKKYPEEHQFKPTQIEESDLYRRCKTPGCLGRGYWQPVLCLSPDGKRYMRIPMRDKIFCKQCKGSIGLEAGGELLTAATWLQIEDMFRLKGREVPERELTYLEWREV